MDATKLAAVLGGYTGAGDRPVMAVLGLTLYRVAGIRTGPDGAPVVELVFADPQDRDGG